VFCSTGKEKHHAICRNLLGARAPHHLHHAALITKEAYSSLFIGVVIGALFACGFAPRATIDMIVNDGIIAAIADNAGIFLFLVLLGIIVALVNLAGGSAAFGRWAERTSTPAWARSLRRSSSASSFSSTTTLTA